jgi:hypothetical protein
MVGRKLTVGTLCRYEEAGGGPPKLARIMKNIYTGGKISTRVIMVIPSVAIDAGYDIKDAFKKVQNKDLRRKVSIREANELETATLTNITTMVNKATAWELLNVEEWREAAWELLDLADIEPDYEEQEDEVPPGGGAADAAGVQGAGGDEVLKMMIKLLSKQQQARPVLTKWDHKKGDWASWLALFGVWQTEMESKGFTVGVSDLLQAFGDTDRANLVKKLGAAMSVQQVLAAMSQKIEGDQRMRLFTILVDWFTYKRKEGASVDDHLSEVSKQKRDVKAILGGVELPDTLWGWYTLYTYSLGDDEQVHLMAMLKGDYSTKNIKMCLQAYNHKVKQAGAEPARENAHKATEQAAEKERNTTEKAKKDMQSLLSKVEELTAAIGSKGKGKGRGRGSADKPSGWKEPCRFGKKCNQKEKCRFYHPPAEVAKAATAKSEGGD